jgi:hypothetical protein
LIAAGGSGAGGELTLHNPSTGETEIIPLPPQNWKTIGSTKNPLGYRYTDRDGSEGPCRLVLVRTGTALRASCPNSILGFTLNEASQGSLSARVVIGETPVGYCVHFGGTVLEDRRVQGFFKRGAFRARNAPLAPECSMGLP